MKKILLAACFMSFWATVSQAQEWSFRLGLGYAFPTASQSLGPDGLPYSGNATYSNNGGNTSYSSKPVSFSAGLKLNAGIQYMFTKNIGVALDVNMGVSSEKYVLQENNGTSINGKYNGSGNVGAYPSDNQYTRHAQFPVMLMPALVIASGGDKINVYARGGFALPIASKILSEERDNYQTVSGDQEQLNKTLTTQFNIGFAGAIGASYRVSENFSFWVEANLLSLSLSPKEEDITAHTLNGEATSVPPATGSKISYLTSGTPNNTNTQLTYSIPFSNVGFIVGASYNLGKRKVVHPQQ